MFDRTHLHRARVKVRGDLTVRGVIAVETQRNAATIQDIREQGDRLPTSQNEKECERGRS
jgi:hypothetical protein